ncbi:MAG TPA: DUF374 domain-containing protein, partial [Alphaproteobacteria bacterium]|nr:DUF374 domain-containing protein [Alphaproteobacteria bacterium]
MRLNRDIATSPPALAVISLLAAGYILLVRATSRLTRVNRQAIERCFDVGRPVIVAGWHGRLLMLPYARTSRSPAYCLISRHGDGELIARTVQRLGVAAVRGSTRRAGKDGEKGGAAALRQLVALLRQGHSVAITP